MIDDMVKLNVAVSLTIVTKIKLSSINGIRKSIWHPIRVP